MPSAATVDVRDMLCAQALALVAQAVARARIGEPLRVLYSAEDVKRDLVIWANERRHYVEEVGRTALRLTRRSGPDS